MSRFGTKSILSIEENVKNSVPKNTVNNKKYVWRQFMLFCEERKYVFNEETQTAKLADILQDWAFNMKKQNGENYKDYTVKTMWNLTAKMLQEKYYNEYHIKFNPFSDIEFKLARDAKSAKRKQLQSNPEKRKSSSVFLKYNEFKKIVDSCNENTPNGLQKKLFFVLSYELAWRGGEGARCQVNYFKMESDKSGNKTGRIEYNPVFTKTTQGGDKPCATSKWLISNKTNTDICPIRLFKKFMQKREDIKNDRLFLTPNPNWNKGNWFKNTPVGRNVLGQWTSHQAEKTGINTATVKITNHSLRATAVSKLAKQGVGEQQLIKITGHSNTKSISSYLQMDEEHHEQIIQQMRTDEIDVQVNCSTTSNTQSMATSNKPGNNNYYYNCVFNNY